MSRSRRSWFVQIVALAAAAVLGQAAHAQKKEVVIGYQDMIVPWRHAQEAKLVEERTGYKVTYRQIGSGAEVVRALASGAIDIGEAGSSPFAAALSQGVPIEVFWILDNINDAEALVARKDSGVQSIADLKGKKIALPFASTTHFHLLVALEKEGIKPGEVQILNLRPPEILAAWQRGDIDATFIWDPVLAQVKQDGSVLVTSGQIAGETGKATFDAIAVRKDFAKDHDAFLTEFVKVLAETDQDYVNNKAGWSAGSDKVRAVAKWSGATAESVPASLALYAFVPPAEQASAQWLGGGKEALVARSLAATAEFLKEQGTIQAVLPDYAAGINPRWVERAAQ
ncbi:taurine ABC transporter substrate-binding protein [Corticibacter populi]|uniref:Taurine ABC transporter substrate-binding protein n=1 Tax=Corticibacter populi TaxID=1550736 RepID=A0A3M6QPQ5_9BURK|nr:taurine ABC transporter substrate-binding protein [Corticibacter populi]RMX05017.1 taurine ABC transporter substrate-binding protein [Corticibacter populi]RZS33551.1 taurine transport system substrate-binding protein [Corticibacter populi]